MVIGLSSSFMCLRSWSRVVGTLACPSYSCTLAMSARFKSALIAVVVRVAWTAYPFTSASMLTGLAWGLTETTEPSHS